MKRESAVFLLGLLIILVPFAGVPTFWKSVIFVCIGILLTVLGYQLRRASYVRSIERENGERNTDEYTEAAPRVRAVKKGREDTVATMKASRISTRQV